MLYRPAGKTLANALHIFRYFKLWHGLLIFKNMLLPPVPPKKKRGKGRNGTGREKGEGDLERIQDRGETQRENIFATEREKSREGDYAGVS